MPQLNPPTIKLLRDMQRLMKHSSHRREASALETLLDWHDRLPDADALRREIALLKDENARLKDAKREVDFRLSYARDGLSRLVRMTRATDQLRLIEDALALSRGAEPRDGGMMMKPVSAPQGTLP